MRLVGAILGTVIRKNLFEEKIFELKLNGVQERPGKIWRRANQRGQQTGLEVALCTKCLGK